MTGVHVSFDLTDETSIPAVGFGTYLISEDEVPIAVSKAIQLGYRHIDTAEGYQNERGVGKGVIDGVKSAGLSREAIFVTTKLRPVNPERGGAAKSMEETIESFNASLERLGLDYIDLYLIHTPFGGKERVSQWQGLLELKRQGRVRAVGVSNFNETHLEEIKDAGLPIPTVNQLELHPWSQKPNLIAYMKQEGIFPVAYSSLVPLSTWRTAPGQGSAKTDEMREEGLNSDSPIKEMAAKYEVSEAQLLLRWAVQSGYAILPKSLRPERMRQNLDLFAFEIDDADMASIKKMDRGDGVAWTSGDPSKVS